MNVVLHLPNFRSAGNKSFVHRKRDCENLRDDVEHFSQHELMQEMTKNFFDSLSESKRINQQNRLLRTISPANIFKIAQRHEIWSYEEKFFGPHSNIGRGLGGMDMLHLGENCQSHLVNLKRRSSIIVDGTEFKRRRLSIIEEEKDHGVISTSSCILSETCETEGVGTLSWAEMVEEELDAKIRSELYIEKRHGERTGVQREVQDFGVSSINNDPGFATSASTDWVPTPNPGFSYPKESNAQSDGADGSVTQQIPGYGTSPLAPEPLILPPNHNGQESEPDKPKVVGIEREELEQPRPIVLSEDDDFAAYLLAQRRACIARRWLTEDVYIARPTFDPQYWNRQRRARRLRIDMRKRVQEIFRRDVRQFDNIIGSRSYLRVYLRPSPATKLTILLNVISDRVAELQSLLASTEYPSKLREPTEQVLTQHISFQRRYQHDRVTSLSNITVAKLTDCIGRGRTLQAVIHANFLDKLIVLTVRGQDDPNGHLWMNCNDWNIAENYYHALKTRILYYQEGHMNEDANGVPHELASEESQAEVSASAGLTEDGGVKSQEARYSESREDRTHKAPEKESPKSVELSTTTLSEEGGIKPSEDDSSEPLGDVLLISPRDASTTSPDSVPTEPLSHPPSTTNLDNEEHEDIVREREELPAHRDVSISNDERYDIDIDSP